MHKLQNPTKDNRSLGTGYCSEKDHHNIPPVSILGRLGMGGAVDNRCMLKEEFRKDNKTEVVHTDTWDVPRLEDFSKLSSKGSKEEILEEYGTQENSQEH